MERVRSKLEVIGAALQTLDEGIVLYKEYTDKAEKNPSKENKQILLAMRDSMIQRFEYCTDLLWKLIKAYLERIEKISLPISSPRGVIREGVVSNLLNEDQADECMNMIKSRNETSHIYFEEIAVDIAGKIPEYYRLMNLIIHKIQNKLN